MRIYPELKVAVLLLLFNIVFVPQGNSQGQQYMIPVQVVVEADNPMKGLITGYVNRELGSLKNVRTVDKNPDWILKVIAAELIDKDGHKTGVVVLSINALKPFSNELVGAFLREEDKETVLKMTSNLYDYPKHWIQSGPRDELDSISKRVVTDFDRDCLEPERKAFCRVQEFLKCPHL